MFMNPVSAPRSRPPVRVTSGGNTQVHPQPVQPPPKPSVNISAAAKAAATSAAADKAKAKAAKPGPSQGVTVNRFLTRADAVWSKVLNRLSNGG